MTKPPPASESTPHQTRWRLRFSLRTWLILVSLLCLLFVYLGRVERQRKAVDAINDAGGIVYYSDRFRSREKSLREWIGRPLGQNESTFVEHYSDYFENVSKVGNGGLTRQGRNNLKPFNFQALSQLGALEELHVGLEASEISGLEGLSRCRSLRKLSLSGGISDSDLIHVEHLHSLKYLWLPKATSDHALMRLSQLGGLEYLSIEKSQVTDEGLKALAKFPNLKELELRNSDITDLGLASLALCSTLEEIDLSETKLQGTGLRHLAELPRLKRLCLDQTLITDESLQALADFQVLEKLQLNHCQVTDRGMLHVAKCRSLRVLSINLTKVSDDGIGELRELPDLRELFCVGDHITDAGLAHMEQFPQLESFAVWGSVMPIDKPPKFSNLAFERLLAIVVERRERNETMRDEANQTHK